MVKRVAQVHRRIQLLQCRGDIWRYSLFSFKSDSPEDLTPLLCWGVCKLYREVPEISRRRYLCVCSCMFLVCTAAACLLPKRSLNFRYNTGRGRRKNRSPRGSAVYNSIYIPAPTDNLYLHFPPDPFIDDFATSPNRDMIHMHRTVARDERTDIQSAIQFSGVRWCIIIKSMIKSLVSHC